MPAGAGCGACGYAGCDSYAAAVVQEGAATNLCPVGGAAVAKKIAAIMGKEAEENPVRMVATVLCRGDNDMCHSRFEYQGLQECRAAFLASGGAKACKYSCLGLAPARRFASLTPSAWKTAWCTSTRPSALAAKSASPFAPRT